MATFLTDIVFPSIYKDELHGSFVLLPSRMAHCTPDTKAALLLLAQDVKNAGGILRLSDLFRSYDMQYQAYLEYVSGKKSAFSPAPGGSMHEAGRAFDLDLAALKMPLAQFWQLADKRGVVPIISKPVSSASEAWHFECRGSHAKVYEDYAHRADINFKPIKAMAVSAILSIGKTVDALQGKDDAARIQSALIRLGESIGNIDGEIGPKTRTALSHTGLAGGSLADIQQALTEKLEVQFSSEFFDSTRQSDSLWQIAGAPKIGV